MYLIIKKFNKEIKEFLKFSIVGFSGTMINLIILYLLTDFLRIYYIFSAIFAFFVAMSNNFIFNKIWTFNDGIKSKITKKYLQFFIVSVIALIVNLFFLYFFTNILGIYYIISQIFAIIPSLIINFLGNKFWTFKRKIE